MKQVVVLGFGFRGVLCPPRLEGVIGELAEPAVVMVQTTEEGGGIARRTVGEAGWVVPMTGASTGEEEEKLGINVAVMDGGGGGGPQEVVEGACVESEGKNSG